MACPCCTARVRSSRGQRAEPRLVKDGDVATRERTSCFIASRLSSMLIVGRVAPTSPARPAGSATARPHLRAPRTLLEESLSLSGQETREDPVFHVGVRHEHSEPAGCAVTLGADVLRGCRGVDHRAHLSVHACAGLMHHGATATSASARTLTCRCARRGDVRRFLGASVAAGNPPVGWAHPAPPRPRPGWCPATSRAHQRASWGWR